MTPWTALRRIIETNSLPVETDRRFDALSVPPRPCRALHVDQSSLTVHHPVPPTVPPMQRSLHRPGTLPLHPGLLVRRLSSSCAHRGRGVPASLDRVGCLCEEWELGRPEEVAWWLGGLWCGCLCELPVSGVSVEEGGAELIRMRTTGDSTRHCRHGAGVVDGLGSWQDSGRRVSLRVYTSIFHRHPPFMASIYHRYTVIRGGGYRGLISLPIVSLYTCYHTLLPLVISPVPPTLPPPALRSPSQRRRRLRTRLSCHRTDLPPARWFERKMTGR
jgi:hypothetical protein